MSKMLSAFGLLSLALIVSLCFNTAFSTATFEQGLATSIDNMMLAGSDKKKDKDEDKDDEEFLRLDCSECTVLAGSGKKKDEDDKKKFLLVDCGECDDHDAEDDEDTMV